MVPRFVLALGGALLATGLAPAQPRPAFDVASLKPGLPIQGDRININLGTARHGVVTLGNASLADCLRFAYNITNNEQIDGPDWMKDKSVRFDIQAKAPPDTPLPRLREMLQTLLDERFKLQFHTAQKNMEYMALVVAKGGPKFSEVPEDTEAAGNIFSIGKIVSNRITMATLITVLSRFTGETIVDFTNLKSWYSVSLEWTPEPRRDAATTGRPPEAADLPLGPSIYSAMQSQLGLKLERRKTPLDVMVVDYAERVPLGN